MLRLEVPSGSGQHSVYVWRRGFRPGFTLGLVACFVIIISFQILVCFDRSIDAGVFSCSQLNPHGFGRPVSGPSICGGAKCLIHITIPLPLYFSDIIVFCLVMLHVNILA
jgi:hypothetical protein